MECETRHQRKEAVFHIMYGAYFELTEEETRQWRALCADWINKGGRFPPLTPAAFKAQQDAKE